MPVTVRNNRGSQSVCPVIFDSYCDPNASLRFPRRSSDRTESLAEGGFVNTHKWVGDFIRCGLSVVAALVLAINCANTTHAQTQGQPQGSAEVQQLKDRLKLLEQTVDELKTQLQAIESSR